VPQLEDGELLGAAWGRMSRNAWKWAPPTP
jgi:hypothetical protein